MFEDLEKSIKYLNKKAELLEHLCKTLYKKLGLYIVETEYGFLFFNSKENADLKLKNVSYELVKDDFGNECYVDLIGDLIHYT